jgi:murein peptide amidase A
VTLEKIACPPPKPDRDTLKIGLFAGLHGDEPAGTLACHQLVAWAWSKPVELFGYELHFYPECNPTGCKALTRESHSGLDLNREFWRGSREPEVIFLETELRRERYDGIIALHSDDTSNGIYGFVSGALLSHHVLEPALAAADSIIPRNSAEVIDGFPAANGIIKEGYPGVLCAPPEQHPRPLEIVFETPSLAPLDLQVQSAVLAVKTILHEYRTLLAYAQNL